MTAQGLPKKERVRKESVISALFAKNNLSLSAPPFRFTWVILEPNAVSCQVLVVSSKKKLKKAVDRNRQKRQLRELYRINKNNLLAPLLQIKVSIALSVIYTGVEPIDVNKQTPQFIKALQKIALAVQKNHTIPVHPAH
ncbi:MAG: ribonuclease P protein component [Bacteroidota bacterium]|nr:ribonuclease P protein component [Bacteroidota bacterium]